MSANLRKELIVILSSAAIFFLLLILEHTGLLPGIFQNRWYSLLLYLIPYFLCGWPVITDAFSGIRNHQPFDESFLMFLATVGAFITGENSEAVAVMVFYQVGEWFQRYALGRSRKSIADLMDLVPEIARIEDPDGSIREVDPEDVDVEDLLVIRPGEKIPVDSVVVSGESRINTAALTGESLPRLVSPGDSIISGCINGEGLLRIRALKRFEDSTVSRILELVENATESKSRTEAFITRFARVYTPAVVYAALALAILPSLLTGRPDIWFYRACTFLVISCPCALVISVPLAFFGGIGAAGRAGVLIKGSTYLELLARLDTLVSDKTGTLTQGNFQVSQVLPAPSVTRYQLLQAAYLAELSSTHPIAASIQEAFQSEADNAAGGRDGSAFRAPLPDSVQNISGQGICASVDGSRILVGNQLLMQENHIPCQELPEAAATVCHVAKDETYLGAILIRDVVKPHAAQAILEMKQEGVRHIVMLTGDRAAVGNAVGAELGVDQVLAELLPQEKVQEVERLLEALKNHPGGHADRLAFVGDGINDAPVLARSDVGIAMGSMGSDAAIEAADVVIMDDDLRKIPVVIRIARKTVAISTQNISFALAAKLLILILGAMGRANMWAAVFADVGVAILCILNSMRLLRYSGKRTTKEH